MQNVNSNYKIGQDFKYVGDDWWEWWIWIDGNEKSLNEVDVVVYTLHPTFFNPVRKIKDRESKFRLTAEGWGTFTIYAKVVLKDGEEISLSHELNLEYPDGSINNA